MQKYFIIMIVLALGLIGLIGCSSKAWLKPGAFPQNYRVDSLNWDKTIKPNITLQALLINNDQFKNREIIKIWQLGGFKNHFKYIHPELEVRENDIFILSEFLINRLDIYYLAVLPKIGQNYEELLEQVKQRIGCNPLSYFELKFMMNSRNSTPFSPKPLSMLIISVHELLLRHKAVPEYPNLLSASLRKKKGLKPLQWVEDFNIRSQSLSLKQQSLGGTFAFCVKNKAFKSVSL